uniref:Uncharacterized protein n=1 Tax=Salix viminalis TaxID=40686 RepID=A0A6N2L2V3_SALVM
MTITVGISPVTNEHCYQDQFMPTAKIFQWHGASGCHMFKENAKSHVIIVLDIPNSLNPNHSQEAS